MKKILYFLTAAAAMLSVACTQEAIETPVEDLVTFEISLEDVAATRSATIGDGSHCDKLIYEVYDATNGVVGDVIESLSKQDITITNGMAELKLNLAKNQSYAIAFWAQNKDCTAYNTEDLKSVKISYDNLESNVETRDAFFAFVKPFKVAGAFNHQVKLYRPFAQLNLAVADLDAVEAAAIELLEVEVETSAATVLDITSGNVSGSKPVTFKSAAVLNSELVLKSDPTKKYPWMAMNYLLPYDEVSGYEPTTEKVTFTIETNKAPITLTSNATPLQRNYRTNIIAKLTESNTFEIVIEEGFSGETNIEDEKDPDVYSVSIGETMYKTINDALAAAKENDVINLAAGEYDLTAGGAFVKATTNESLLVISNGVTIQGAVGVHAENVVLNGQVRLMKGALKNVYLSGKNVPNDDNIMSSAFNGDCLVENVIFNCPAPTTGTVNAFKEYSGMSDGEVHNLTFKNCTFNANGQRPLQFDIMNVTVEGCTFDNPYRYCVQLGMDAKGCNLTFKNNTVKNYGSTGKDFYTYVQIDDQEADRNNVVLLSGNMQSTTVEGAAAKWADYVVENTASNVQITVDGRQALADGVVYDPETKVAEITKGGADIDVALKKGAAELRLVDGEYKLTASFTQDVKFVGASKDTKIEYTSNNMSGVDATFENVTMVTPNAVYKGFTHADEITFNDVVFDGLYFCYSAKTVFNNCTFNQTKLDYNIWTYGSNVDFNNCVFNCAGKAALVYADTYSGNWLTVNFKDCKFYASTPAKDGKAAIEIDSSLVPENVNIEGCTAEGFDLGSKSGNSLYNLKKGEYGVNCNLTVNLADGVKFYNGAYEISNGNGLAWASANVFIANEAKVVNIMNDIDMSGISYTPVHYTTNTGALTLNGNGYVISNLKVEGTEYAGLLGRVSSKVVINDLTIKDSNFSAITSTNDENTCGAFIALYGCYSGNVESALNNCKAINVTYGSAKYVGGLVGFGNMSSAHPLLISNCEVDGADITSEFTENGSEYKGHCGGFVGGAYNATIQNSVIKNSNITVKGPRYGAVIGSILDGTTVFGEGIVVDNVIINGAKATSANVVGAVNNTNCDPSVVTVK